MFYDIEYDAPIDITLIDEEKSINGKLKLKQDWHEVSFFSNSLANNYVKSEQDGLIHGYTAKGKVTLLNVFWTDSFFKTTYHRDYRTTVHEASCEFALFGRKHVSKEDRYYGMSFNLTPQSSSELFVPNDYHETTINIHNSVSKNEIYNYDPIPEKFETGLGNIKLSFERYTSVGWDSSSRSYAKFKIDFGHPISFNEVYERLVQTKLFFSMFLGYIPELENIEIYSEQHPDFGDQLRVFPPRKGYPQKSDHLHVPCILKPVNSDEFKGTMRSWLVRYADREDAVKQFANDFRTLRPMADRVVSVVNVFDLLPKEDVARPDPLPNELVNGINDLKETAMRTMKGDARKDSMCSAISRLKEINRLKTKIQSRFEIISRYLEKSISDDCIKIIADMVDLRNQYVHGTKCKRKTKYPEVRMVSTLNFGFCISELIECGWRPKHHDLLQMFKFSVKVI